MHAEPRISAAPRLARSRPRRASVSVHQDLAAAEPTGAASKQTADCTPFQTFDWLSAWQRHVGTPNGITPAIVVARRGDQMLLLLPLAVARARLRRAA